MASSEEVDCDNISLALDEEAQSLKDLIILEKKKAKLTRKMLRLEFQRDRGEIHRQKMKARCTASSKEIQGPSKELAGNSADDPVTNNISPVENENVVPSEQPTGPESETTVLMTNKQAVQSRSSSQQGQEENGASLDQELHNDVSTPTKKNRQKRKARNAAQKQQKLKGKNPINPVELVENIPRQQGSGVSSGDAVPAVLGEHQSCKAGEPSGSHEHVTTTCTPCVENHPSLHTVHLYSETGEKESSFLVTSEQGSGGPSRSRSLCLGLVVATGVAAAAYTAYKHWDKLSPIVKSLTQLFSKV